MQGVDRTRRVGEVVRRALAGIISRKFNHSSMGIISITTVTVSKDLKFARAFVSALSSDLSDKEIIENLNAHSGEIRWELASQVQLRRTPEIVFSYDKNVERAANMAHLLNDLK